MSDVIVTHRLTKYYGRRCVVDALDLRVPAGCVYGLLGRNGSGKHRRAGFPGLSAASTVARTRAVSVVSRADAARPGGLQRMWRSLSATRAERD